MYAIRSYYAGANDTIALQWSAVGTLRDTEAYAVTVEDVTEGEGRKLVRITSYNVCYTKLLRLQQSKTTRCDNKGKNIPNRYYLMIICE